jgi:hypothetical protein
MLEGSRKEICRGEESKQNTSNDGGNDERRRRGKKSIRKRIKIV